jgi:hypothetical protein
MANMRNKIQNYIVSSGGWEIKVDHSSPKKAAISGLLMAIEKMKDKLTISTVIMVNKESQHINDNVVHAEFFSSPEIFNELGMCDISRGIKKFFKLCN